MRATMTVWGLNTYFQSLSPARDLFEYFTVPEGLSKEDAAATILMATAELETIYPNPAMLQQLIGVWSRTRQAAWEHIHEALTAEYNLLHNYDRSEEWTDTRNGSRTGSRNMDRDGDNTHTETSSGSRSVDRDGKDTHTETTSGGENKTVTTHSEGENTSGTTVNDEVTTQVSGYDSNAFVNHDKSTKVGNTVGTSNTETDGTETTAGTTTGSRSLTDVIDETDAETTTGNRNLRDVIDETDAETSNETSTDRATHTGRVSGNIGVTTSQQMIESELRLRLGYNLYDIIADEFKRRFCILIY